VNQAHKKIFLARIQGKPITREACLSKDNMGSYIQETASLMDVQNQKNFEECSHLSDHCIKR